MKIYTDNAPILRQKALKVSFPLNPDLKKLILDMKKIVEKEKGVGLAAPQVGELLKIIVVNLEEQKLTLINPKITRRSFKKEKGEEGCLSLPNIFLTIKRPKRITVKYFDENGQKIKLKADGLLSRVIQHEIDHLNGILITDYRPQTTENR